ncbi:MAG: ISAs1 family transposase [Chloroflexi bacterium]|nr:ISAs1 family transposase [Chloroflexota bacterium]MBU1750128.1 ISAs1 family transposase [Chloroflexota bacterium]
MTYTIRPLIDYLALVGDPRARRGVRHPLPSILCLCCVALLGGAKNPRAMAQWWRHRRDLGAFLERLGFTREYGPSQATLYRILALIPIAQLEAILQQWAEDNLAQLPPAAAELEPVALDGKTLRGSRRQGAVDTHLLSAFSHRLGLTLCQLAVPDATNEIGALPDLLATVVIAGRVFTMDALLTQRSAAQTIVDEQGDYVMYAKDNQPTLHDDIAQLFAAADPEFITDAATTVDKGHGRLERRTLQTSTALQDYLDWPGHQQVFRLDRYTRILKTGARQMETVYGLTSLAPQRAGAADLLALTRGQWGIENRSHWVRDVTLGEDLSQVRQGRLPQVMAALRNAVIAVIRLLGFRFIPDALGYFAARPSEALAVIGC